MTSVGRIGLLVAAVAVVVAGCSSSTDGGANAQQEKPAVTTSASASATSSSAAPVAAGACAYGTARGAAKEVNPPTNVNPPTEGFVSVNLETSAGPIGLTLDRAEAPCTTESFVSLISQQYYDATPCHRLTTQGIFVLQCGDPTGQGTGGPGYTVPDELPTTLAPYLMDGQPTSAVIYPRGSIAMANAGPNTVGSQFFLVYKDSPLPPSYTVVGQIDEAGLATLDAVAAKGVAPTASDQLGADGAPAEPVEIIAATLPNGI
ncbi:peptidylprolyl isomerase [Tomitella biformata]|uniref:peptidylprolyl isomerase n=1 Tax=Tomitella biformata TaxID=630403 RepID=UPI0005709074|nr:peptidylprolyl isomerase [Tomitella biformata]